MRNYYVVVNGVNNPYEEDADEYILLAFRTEEFADNIAQNLNQFYEDDLSFYVTSYEPLDYLEDTHIELYKEIMARVYKTVMGAMEQVDINLSKSKEKPYLRVVK